MADRVTLSAARLLALHDAVICGDPPAVEQIWIDLWRPLCGRLRRQFPTAPADLVADAATDAIRAYLANPHVFDRSRQPLLEAYVFGIAEGMLRDQQRSAKRRAKREGDWATARQAYEGQSGDGAMSRVLAGQIRATIPSVCNEREAGAMTRWLETDDPVAVAACLGLSDIPIMGQRRAAWALWDAVVKRLKRRLRKASGGGQVACHKNLLTDGEKCPPAANTTSRRSRAVSGTAWDRGRLDTAILSSAARCLP